MHRKRAVFLMACGAALIAASLALIVANRAEDVRAGDRAAEVVHAMRAVIPSPAAEPLSPAAEAPAAEPSAEIDGESYIGILSIPALELELPVMSRCDEDTLKTSPGRYAGSVSTGDLVIAGHNYDRHFGRLSLLAAGDPVSFTAADGRVYLYETVLLQTLAPTAVTEMTDSGYDLTLYTCTYGGQNRVAVRCALVGEE